MNTKTATFASVPQAVRPVSFTWMERWFLKRTHPRMLFLASAGMMWEVYFLWHHAWMPALLIVLAVNVAAWMLTSSEDLEKIAQTTLGRIALLHLHPINLTVQVLGLVLLATALWMHAIEGILAGTTVILLGHWFGWEKV